MTSRGGARHQVTRLLEAWRAGDETAGEELFPLVYAELRRIAGGYLKIERADHTLQPTALVHEAYLRLVDQRGMPWRNRSHFFAIAAKMVRRILVDHARRHAAARRGGGLERVTLSSIPDPADGRPENLLLLDRALDELEKSRPDLAEVVEYRYFAGLTGEATAEVLGVSAATVKRRWQLARAWLFRELQSS